MKKRLVSVLLCAAMAMAAAMAAGCGSDAGSGSGSDSGDAKEESGSSDEKTTLTFWCHEYEPWVKSYKEMA